MAGEQRAARRAFRDALLAVGDRPGGEPRWLTARLVEALPAFAGRTPDVLAAAEHLLVAAEREQGGTRLVLGLRDYQAGLATVLWLAGGCELPPAVRARWAGLGQEEWESGLLVAKLVLSALESRLLRDGEPVPDPGRDQLRSALAAFGEHPERGADALAAEVVAGLLAFGSETPDNLAATAHLTAARDGRGGLRLTLHPSGVHLGDLLAAAVGTPLPDEVLDDLPDLGQEEWDAVLHLTALILTALESEPS
ncbi:hypothetical protein [Kitasatospora camelliae]|uniref:Uncharacterized protein n=1 Tax=Kitasatospora camelliae TaxID=3156397 RepID=A0AAU8JWS8_9ACTN